MCIVSALSGAQNIAAGDTPDTRQPSSQPSPQPGSQPSPLSNVLLDRAQQDVARIKALVEQGTLPKTMLDEAEAKLADAQDQVILSETLYGATLLEHMTQPQADAMVEAARRRVERQAQLVAERQRLLDNGIISKAELSSFQLELDSRQRVLNLAQNRKELLEQLRAMAETEQRLARAARPMGDVLIRYEGDGAFSLADLPAISTEFQKRFHRALPVSALGQTLVHQSMGLDHRNRVDVALNPDSSEGIWLRQLLEKWRLPYLAFRSAVAGAATAPHIHIGLGSTRLKLASR